MVPGDLGIPGVELRSHCTYRRDEVLAGIGWADGTRKTRGQAAGVVYSEATNVDALLVTLQKEEKDFAPSTRYRDYPMSADLFHWESQNSTTLASAVGRRYIKGTSRVVLFVRARAPTSSGRGAVRLPRHGDCRRARGRAPDLDHLASRPAMPQSLLQAGAVDAA